MTNKIYFCPKTLGFYNEDNKSDYESAGTWPAELIEITKEKRDGLLIESGAGYVIAAASNGNPILTTPPEPTVEDLIA